MNGDSEGMRAVRPGQMVTREWCDATARIHAARERRRAFRVIAWCWPSVMGATVCAALAVRHFPPHLAEMPVWAPAAAAVAFNLAGWLFVLDFFRARKP